MKPVIFAKLKPGERFEDCGMTWRKLESQTPRLEGMNLPGVHNAMMLERRQTGYFPDHHPVMPLRVPSLSFWRKWLITRSLRWHFAGFARWAGWSWRLSRALATEQTHQALAAHVTTLMMMGE